MFLGGWAGGHFYTLGHRVGAARCVILRDDCGLWLFYFLIRCTRGSCFFHLSALYRGGCGTGYLEGAGNETTQGLILRSTLGTRWVLLPTNLRNTFGLYKPTRFQRDRCCNSDTWVGRVGVVGRSRTTSMGRISEVVTTTMVTFLLVVYIFTADTFTNVTARCGIIVSSGNERCAIAAGRARPARVLGRTGVTLNSGSELSVTNFATNGNNAVIVSELGAMGVRCSNTVGTCSICTSAINRTFTRLGVGISNYGLGCSIGSTIRGNVMVAIRTPLAIAILTSNGACRLGATNKAITSMVSLTNVALNSTSCYRPSISATIRDKVRVAIYEAIIGARAIDRAVGCSARAGGSSDVAINRTGIRATNRGNRGGMACRMACMGNRRASELRLASMAIGRPMARIGCINATTTNFRPGNIRSGGKCSINRAIDNGCARCYPYTGYYNGGANGATSNGGICINVPRPCCITYG